LFNLRKLYQESWRDIGHDINDLPEFLTLATFVSDIYQHHFQQGTMPRTPAIVAGSFGNGNVILFSPHPELTDGMESLLLDALRAVQGKQNISK
jgi:hypothetical protein